MADGTNNTGVSLGRTMVSFSPETVQEFTVQTTAYSAEYGTTGGGVISATTKIGTQPFSRHGAVVQPQSRVRGRAVHAGRGQPPACPR